MSVAKKAMELYMGEKGLLFRLNKFAYASIFIMIGAPQILHDRCKTGFSWLRSKIQLTVIVLKCRLTRLFRIKKDLAKKMKQNRAISQWICLRINNTFRYNAKRRHCHRTKLGF
ncbi:uncharacterized protein LOC120073688 [Benincasa hispida]|uniref:uncharacterized protein LOC120073688 n=1 Tax=Benincasa hispida TaxID=102211 RepID=UPI0018FF222E|nr:uncharacterized protein LOC120073688 [Benincasa hispida]